MRVILFWSEYTSQRVLTTRNRWRDVAWQSAQTQYAKSSGWFCEGLFKDIYTVRSFWRKIYGPNWICTFRRNHQSWGLHFWSVDVLEKFRKRVLRVRKEIAATRLFHYDNDPSHIALRVLEFLTKSNLQRCPVCLLLRSPSKVTVWRAMKRIKLPWRPLWTRL